MKAFDQAVRTIQFLSVDAVEQANSGHPGTPMALAGIGVEIFTRHLRYQPQDPNWPNRDRFVLSCGHASMLLYSLLHLAGYGLPIEELKNFRQWGSKTPGHPEYSYHTPGVETTTGPLGAGFSNSVGFALASKMAGARLNTADSSLIDYRVFVLASDGDLMEGVASEAASIAGHLKLDNLVVVYDDNHITIDGRTEIAFSEDVGKRFEAYGWFVQKVDGHDTAQVSRALTAAVDEPARPSLIVARTHIAIGAPTKQDTPAAHGAPLGKAEVTATKQAAGWPLEPTFYVPAEAYEPFKARSAEIAPQYAAWQKSLAALKGERAALWKALTERQLPPDLYQTLLAVAGDKADATRSHASKIQQKAAELVPALVGGSADLAESVRTNIKGGGDVEAGEFAGRNLHFGIREHAMGGIVNGLALSGFFIPYGSTFLIFSDYMRPPLRLAALMKTHSLFVYSHDSVFLGEDGPTHQPIEQLSSLRLIPNLDVVRPADALECAAAWTYALQRCDGPTALVLSRQKLPALERPKSFDPKSVLEGAYVVADSDRPELVLIATGSEVHLAVEARRILEEKGRRVRVVSAPCWQAFERLPAQKQEEILASPARRVVIEAGATGLWRGAVGLNGLVIGIDHFGASAPWERIAEEWGFTGPKIAERVLAFLG
ncbi:MAG TPA: transketolase [Polyangiaceae bacterium]|nr:transketolase [Polyangiaceae bacterium]